MSSPGRTKRPISTELKRVEMWAEYDFVFCSWWKACGKGRFVWFRWWIPRRQQWANNIRYLLVSLSSQKHLASGSKDNTIRVCNLANGECVRRFIEHSRPVLCLESIASFGQQLLASGSHDRAINCEAWRRASVCRRWSATWPAWLRLSKSRAARWRAHRSTTRFGCGMWGARMSANTHCTATRLVSWAWNWWRRRLLPAARKTIASKCGILRQWDASERWPRQLATARHTWSLGSVNVWQAMMQQTPRRTMAGLIRRHRRWISRVD